MTTENFEVIESTTVNYYRNNISKLRFDLGKLMKNFADEGNYEKANLLHSAIMELK